MSYRWASPYEASGWTCYPSQPGLYALAAWISETYRVGSVGRIAGCTVVAGTNTPSVHRQGRALDYMLPLVNRKPNPVGDKIVQRIGPHAWRLGIQMNIWNRRYWNARYPTGRAYSGQHPHHDHLHIEMTWQAARYVNLATVRAVLGSVVVPTPPQPEEPMLKQGDTGWFIYRLKEAVNNYRSAQGITGRVAVNMTYDSKMVEYVKHWQTAAGLPERMRTGQVDGVTAAGLLEWVKDRWA